MHKQSNLLKKELVSNLKLKLYGKPSLLEKPFFPWGWRHAEHILVDGFVDGLLGAGGGEVGTGDGEGVVFSGEGGGVVGSEGGCRLGERRRTDIKVQVRVGDSSLLSEGRLTGRGARGDARSCCLKPLKSLLKSPLKSPGYIVITEAIVSV